MVTITFTATNDGIIHPHCIDLEDPRRALAYAESLRTMTGINDVSVVWDLLEEFCGRMKVDRPQYAQTHGSVQFH